MHALHNPFALEIVDRARRRTQKHRAQMIDKHAIDLFRHSTIEGPQTCLYVDQRYVELRGRERPGQGGVRVPVDNHCLRILRNEDVFHSFEHAAGHFAVQTAMNVQKIARRTYAELCKKYIGHVRVEVLPGVNNHLLELAFLQQLPGQGERLDKLRPCAQHRHDPRRQPCVLGSVMV